MSGAGLQQIFMSGDISRQNRHLGANLQIMGAEMRAGRSAWQIGWDWAISLAAMLGHSVELGADLKVLCAPSAMICATAGCCGLGRAANQLPAVPQLTVLK